MQPFVSKNHDTSKKGKSPRQQRKPREQYRPSESPEILFLGKTYWKQHQLASNLECGWRGFESAGRHYVHNRGRAARQYELCSHETQQTDCVVHVMLSLATFFLLFFTPQPCLVPTLYPRQARVPPPHPPHNIFSCGEPQHSKGLILFSCLFYNCTANYSYA